MNYYYGKVVSNGALCVIYIYKKWKKKYKNTKSNIVEKFKFMYKKYIKFAMHNDTRCIKL